MIINKVSELRKEKNITQGQLATELGVSRQTIISLEDNKSNISLYFAMKISKFFNKPIEQIFIEKDMINYFNNKALDGKFADYTKTNDLATVATSGSYNDLTDLPEFETVDIDFKTEY